MSRNWLIATLALLLGITLYLANRNKATVSGRGDLLILHARIIDCTGRPPIEHAALVIEKGKIASISTSNNFEPPPGAQVIDAAGKTVLPALIDTSVHVFIGSAGPAQTTEEFMPERTLADMRALVYWGVLAVRDSGDSAVLATRFRDSARSSDRVAPNICLSVPWVTAVGGYPANFLPAYIASDATKQLSSAADIPSAIGSLQQSGVNFTEVAYDGGSPYHPYPKLSPELLQGLLNEAHSKGLRAAVLTRTNQELVQAVQSGADCIEHLSGELLDDQAIGTLKRHNVYYCALLAEHRAEAASTDEIDQALNTTDVQQTVPAVIRKGLAAHRGYFFDLKSDQWARAYFNESLSNSRRNLELVSKSGVKIALASGAGAPAVFFGLSAHEELALMVASGLSPMQALISATKNAAELIGAGDRLGVLEPGMLANLLVVDGDPLENIAATKNISVVIKDGKIVQRGDLIHQ